MRLTEQMKSKVLTILICLNLLLLTLQTIEIVHTDAIFSLNPASPEYITITGNLFYWDYANIERPLVWARVWITDREPDGLDYILREVFSDVNGYFNSGPIVNDDGPGEDGLDISIYIVAWNWAVQVVNPDGISYYGIVGPYNDLPDGTYHFQIEMPQGHGAWMIFSYHNGIAAGWNYIETQTGYEMAMATVRWPYETLPHYHPGGEIHLPDWAAWYPDIILHEYTHHVMYSLYGYLPPALEEHYINETSDASTAWVEGWADFFPLAVQNDPDFWGWNLETPHWCSAGWDDGDEVEGRVAGALWDIFDSDDDGYDTFFDGFTRIWDIMETQPCDTFREFWDEWTARNETGQPGYPKQPALMAIFQNSIDYRGPGDANGDGVVNLLDALTIRGLFGTEKEFDPEFQDIADLNHDEIVNSEDALIVRANFGNVYDC